MALLDDLAMMNKRTGADMSTQISMLKAEVKDTLERLRKDMKVMKDAQSAPTKQTDLATGPADFNQDYQHVAIMLEKCRVRESEIAISMILLDSTCFDQMKFRHAKIPDVHPQTFDWVFAAKFKSWAESPDPIFWISGKPGSGKSTLMKHIVDNDRTPTMLAEWSGMHNLAIASYFFWVNGTAIQRSQEGLLRALLYDVLCQSPSMIKHAFPEAWMAVRDRLTSSIEWRAPPWTREDLLNAFNRLSTLDNMDTKLCIFIDGLDEYDGDHEDLIQTVQHLKKLGVKLCIASRPWNVFEDAFGSDIEKKIYMQELNMPDMKRFVKDRLRSHPNFRRLTDHQASEITTEIVDKSQGVFLWVYLVVRSLLEGLRNQDSLKLLRKRLRAFPSDLDEFFRHMFQSLDPIYRTHLSHMFQIALTAARPLSPIAYWFLDRIEDDPNMDLDMPVQPHSRQDAADKIREVTVRVNGRSKGLLEVGLTRASVLHYRKEALEMLFSSDSAVEASVDFLHRTVKDFLLIPETQQILADWQEPDFRPNLTICKITLAEFKYTTPLPRSLYNILSLKPTVKEFLRSARCYEHNNNESPIVYVDGFEQAIAKQPHLKDSMWHIWDCSSFLQLVIIHDLKLYITAKLTQSTFTNVQRYALLLFMARRKTFWDDSDGSSNHMRQSVEMMAVILKSAHDQIVDATLHRLLEARLLRLRQREFDDNVYALLQHAVIDKNTREEIRAARVCERCSVECSSDLIPEEASVENFVVSQPLFGKSTNVKTGQEKGLINPSMAKSEKHSISSSRRTSLRGSFKKMLKKLT
jgi:hypothetical protein